MYEKRERRAEAELPLGQRPAASWPRPHPPAGWARHQIITRTREEAGPVARHGGECYEPFMVVEPDDFGEAYPSIYIYPHKIASHNTRVVCQVHLPGMRNTLMMAIVKYDDEAIFQD